MLPFAEAFGIKIEKCWQCGTELESENYFFWQQEPERKFCSEKCYYESFNQPDEKFNYVDLISDIKEVLSFWNIPFSEKFLSPDGLVVVALLCNAAAKVQEWGVNLENYSYMYDIKPYLVAQAALKHVNVWHDEGIVYFETCVGQISFHVFEEGFDWELLPKANGRKWEPRYMQDNAEAIAKAFLNENNHYLEFQLVRFLGD